MKKVIKIETPKTPEQIMKKLHADLIHWQRELRLDNIDIEIRWMHKEEEPDKFARCHVYAPLHLATVSFQLPQNRGGLMLRAFNSDYEVVLVHELLHVRDSNYRSGEMIELLSEEVTNELYEISLDAVAEALVRARRGIKR